MRKQAVKKTKAVVRSKLAALASRINLEHARAELALTRGAVHAIKAGELLVEAKDAVAHGEWAKWLNKNCPQIPERTASLWMKIARNRKLVTDPNRQRVADLTVRDVVKLIRDAEDRGRSRAGVGQPRSDPDTGALLLRAQPDGVLQGDVTRAPFPLLQRG